jgi:hypothetical protein
MDYRANAVLAIGRRRLFETLIHPGFYVVLTLGLAIVYALVSGFLRSVDSSGFDYTLTPLYNFAGGIIAGAFGAPFLGKLFADGPFLFALHIGFLPVLLYLAMSSVFRFGSEKTSGAIELLCYGPSDGTAYFLASLMKDLVLTAAALLAFLLFFIVAGVTDNLAVSAPFLVSLPVLFLACLAMYAYGVLVSVLTDSANSALSLFLAGFILFLVSLLGSQAIVGGYARSLTTVTAWIIQWFSPFYYWSIGMKAQANGEAGLFAVSLLGQFLLIAAVLAASHLIVKRRGVRA